ncbi:MAG TPA: DUF3379 family protein [Povalibacter sp.]|nr:DUF3379 family protein [Povalibacter sp.]
MNCLEFRRIVGAEPRSTAPEVVAHATQCEACARYQQQMQQMDQLIHRALLIDVTVPANTSAATPANEQPREIPQIRPRRHAVQWSLAASVLLAVALVVFWAGYPRDTLAADAVQHALGEPDSLQRTSAVVTEEEMAEVLAHARVRLKSDMGPVSYATVCPFRGHHVPHFVVQTDAGPVTVLLLRDEKPVARARTFREGKFEGVIVPAPQGVLAVLGQQAPVKDVAAKVLAAVEYQEAW